MRSYTLTFLILSLGTIACLFSCNKKGDDTPKMMEEEEKPFDRVAMLTNIFDHAVLPAYEMFEQEAEVLSNLAATFSQTPNRENLLAVQNQWKTSKLAWEQTEVFDLGEIGDLFLHNKVDKFPQNLDFLEENLDSENELNQAFVANSGSTAKGLVAIEYLLFRSEAGEDILVQFTTGSRQLQYRSYLAGLTADVLVQAQALLQQIKSEREAWITNAGDGISASINELANAQVAILEEVISNKLSKPLGYDNTGVAEPDKVETPYANIDFEVIRANLTGIHQSFQADTSFANLYDLLDHVQPKDAEKLSATIEAAFQASFQSLATFDTTLAVSVIENKTAVEALSAEIRKILVGIKVDMENILGLTIVFNDTDGD